jgi:hypothetical protein
MPSQPRKWNIGQKNRAERNQNAAERYVKEIILPPRNLENHLASHGKRVAHRSREKSVVLVFTKRFYQNDHKRHADRNVKKDIDQIENHRGYHAHAVVPREYLKKSFVESSVSIRFRRENQIRAA